MPWPSPRRFSTPCFQSTRPHAWTRVRRALEFERDRILDAIRSYPPPIPACDAQFNHLLEMRARLSDRLARAAEALATRRSLAACSRFVDELAAANLITEEAEAELRACLRDAVDGS